MPQTSSPTSRSSYCVPIAVVVLACAVIAAGCSAPAATPPAPAPTARPTLPVATPSFGLTLPFPKEANTGRTPAFVTIEDIPIMGFYVNKGGLVLAPHEATLVEVMLVTHPTALLKEGGLVLNFIHPAGFASQIYLWQGQAVQQDKSGNLRPLTLTPAQPSVSYGPAYRGQVVALAGDPFPQPQFKGANLLLTLARADGTYIPPDTLWLHGKPQYIATPTPAK
ncbi:MAG: hypothetical protein Kow00123_25280 [Anaerolineales bacterium]